jgi:hypothetical protein
MADTIPEMIVAAGPFIGRETSTPVWRTAESLRTGKVEIGNSRVVDEDGSRGGETPAPATK